MTNFRKRKWKLWLPVFLCTGLTACSHAGDMTGRDWRTMGAVVGSGTITHEGEGSVDVLVTVDEDSAAFYRDLPEQILFDSVAFPISIPDAKESFLDISFDDLNCDGETDVYVSFLHDSGQMTELVWIWDPEERYVFWEGLSDINVDGGERSFSY